MSASTILSDADRQTVEAAIHEAETKTCAEIVVVLARKSGRYDRAEDVVGLLGAMAVLAAATLIWPAAAEAGSWRTGLRPGFGLAAALALVAAGWAIGAFAASTFPALARPFISKRHKLAEVKRRGLESFHVFKMRRTGRATGVLIYASLFEHVVWVCPDDEAAQHLDDAASARIRDAALEGFKSGEAGRGLAEAVRRCGELLGEVLPPEAGDRDELPNRVHVLE